MEHGFYHPSRGYWQTNSEPPQHILDGYPEGTVEVPLKPGADYELDGLEWIAVPAPPPTPDQVRAEGERRLRAAAGNYTDAERETWTVQVDEARAVLADASAAAPMLTPLAAARGLTITEMAQRVLDKAQALASASGAILAAQSVLIATDPIPQDYAADHHWPDPATQQ